MKYKALMLDVDGTLIPYEYFAVPSDRVAEAIKKAQEKVEICIVTGRSFGSLGGIFEKINLKSGFAVVDNGARVVDIVTKNLIYDRPLVVEDAKFIAKVLDEEGMTFYLKQELTHSMKTSKPHSKDEPITIPYMFYCLEEFSFDQVERVRKKLSHLNDIIFYGTQHRTPDKYGINITHINATKLQGVTAIMEERGFRKEEIIGVGDAYNDFPLLMAAGLKVAMGNAIEDLKAIADYVAPSVSEDGVADVIEKFILV